MQAEVQCTIIEPYVDKVGKFKTLYVLVCKHLGLSITFNSRYEHPELLYRKYYDLIILDRKPSTDERSIMEIRCMKSREYLKETPTETEDRYRYRFVSKTAGMLILFDGMKEYLEFVRGKHYFCTLDRTKRGSQKTISDYINDHEVAGAKS